MVRRPCRRSEPSSSDAEEVSVFDRSRQGSVITEDKEHGAVYSVTRKKIKMGKPGTLAQGLDDMQMTLYSTYTY